MSKYDKLKQSNNEQAQSDKRRYATARKGLDELAADAERTVELYQNAEKYLNSIDAQFEKATGLDKTDVAFLLLATALQIGRWLVIGELNGIISKKIEESRVVHDDQSIKDMEKKKRYDYKAKHKDDKHVESKHRDWANIVFDSVPYDITRGSSDFRVNMKGGYHRLHTLGHDPVLGWIFGTMNILSDTITLDRTHGLRTYKVEMMEKPKRWTGPYSATQGFIDSIESVKEDQNRLPAAVFAQALHLKSDAYTKLGLPIPVLEAFTPNLASKLYKEGYDTLKLMKDIAIVGAQAVVSVLINMLISLMHGMFYREEDHASRELYEIKTRKILMWSNIIASSSNAVAVAGMEVAAFFSKNPKLAKKGWQYLDIGGYVVTMYRIVTDTKFIHRVKKEFLEREWEKLVVGEEYTFISEGSRDE
ncbi:MAG: hypothetical protein ACOYI7_06535 [Candidatus Excrementavichristensenella sp.]|jgi:hypothetical protein